MMTSIGCPLALRAALLALLLTLLALASEAGALAGIAEQHPICYGLISTNLPNVWKIRQDALKDLLNTFDPFLLLVGSIHSAADTYNYFYICIISWCRFRAVAF